MHIGCLKVKPLLSRKHFKPFDFPFCYNAYVHSESMHWLPQEIKMEEDIKDWQVKLSSDEKEFLTQIFRFFTQADVEVCGYYNQLAMILQLPEINLMVSSFQNREAIHIEAYSLLINSLNLPESEFKAFLEYKAITDKFDELNNFSLIKEHITPFDLLESIAIFSGFVEGLQLFSAFAMLLNFQRQGKMKGMCQIVAWSILDECYSEDTEILTTQGWKLFSDLSKDDLVAQFDKDTKIITFIKPKRIVSYEGERDMVEVVGKQKKSLNFKVTANHRKLIYYDSKYLGQINKVMEAKDINIHQREKLPVAGYIYNSHCDLWETLTPLHQLLIVLQADGFIPKGKYRNGNYCGYRRCVVNLTKTRKIIRLRQILKEGNFQYSEFVKKDGKISFDINFPKDRCFKYFADWVDLTKVSVQWCNEFLEELVHWDGHVQEGQRYYYSSAVKSNIDIIQAIASLSGWQTRYFTQEDNRKESYKTMHRLTFFKQDFTPLSQKSATKTITKEKGIVWCVEVKTGFIVTRRDGAVCVSGNTYHSNSMIKLYNELKKHFTGQFDQRLLEDRIYNTVLKMIAHEDVFIDSCFKNFVFADLDSNSIKIYVRYLAQERLKALEIYKSIPLAPEKTPLPWFDTIARAPAFTNFFEGKPIEYSKGQMKGDWE